MIPQDFYMDQKNLQTGALGSFLYFSLRPRTAFAEVRAVTINRYDSFTSLSDSLFSDLEDTGWCYIFDANEAQHPDDIDEKVSEQVFLPVVIAVDVLEENSRVFNV
jgi:hypothetical protein